MMSDQVVVSDEAKQIIEQISDEHGITNKAAVTIALSQAGYITPTIQQRMTE